MAILTFLLSLVARKVNNIIQAIFGWSITALFGRLPRRSQILVTGALLCALAWPLFVLGVFLPKVAAWVIAFVPLHDLVGETALRIVWIVLAVVTPLVVGLLVWLAAPLRKGGPARALVAGYPTALAFFLAFVVVAVTVPIIKIASIARRWSDEHVYVQPHAGRYEDVIRILAEATARAGANPQISDAPHHMVLATSIMRTLARGAVAPLVADKLRRVTADGLEIYLYPADLLIRGRADKVAHVRAMFGRTRLDAHAYLVASDPGQQLQDELAHLTHQLDANQRGDLLVAGLQDVYRKLMNTELPYDDFVILDLISRRFERKLLSRGLVSPKALPVDRVEDHLAEIEHRLHAIPIWTPVSDEAAPARPAG